MLSPLSFAGAAAVCIGYNNWTSRIVSPDCVSVTDSFFGWLHPSATDPPFGGAICSKSPDSSTISATTFFFCSVYRTADTESQGGALAMAGPISVISCCSSGCHSDDTGGFVHCEANDNLYFASTSILLTDTSARDSSGGSGTIAIRNEKITFFQYVNFTRCSAAESGAVCTFELSQSVSTVTYVTVMNGTGDRAIDSRSDNALELNTSHFYHNNGGSVLYAHYKGMNVTKCVFSNNFRDIELAVSVQRTSPFVLTDCVFAGAFPAGGDATLEGKGNHENTMTATVDIGFTTQSCPTPPPSSSVFSPSPVLSQSSDAVPATPPLPDSRISAFSPFATASQTIARSAEFDESAAVVGSTASAGNSNPREITLPRVESGSQLPSLVYRQSFVIVATGRRFATKIDAVSRGMVLSPPWINSGGFQTSSAQSHSVAIEPSREIRMQISGPPVSPVAESGGRDHKVSIPPRLSRPFSFSPAAFQSPPRATLSGVAPQSTVATARSPFDSTDPRTEGNTFASRSLLITSASVSQQPPNASSGSTAALWAGIGAGIAIVAAVALLLFFRRRSSLSYTYSGDNTVESPREMTGTPSLATARFENQDFLNPASMLATDLFASAAMTQPDAWAAFTAASPAVVE
jgi:hypothetical protein